MSLIFSRTKQTGGGFSLNDLLLLLIFILVLYSLLGLVPGWFAPLNQLEAIDLSLSKLPRYVFYSFMRGVFAYFLSVSFALLYGYIAAHSRSWEQVLIPL